MKLSFANKHAIICGGTDGIGKSTAELLAASGCEVTLVARNQKKLEMVKSSLSLDHGQNHQVVCADFNEPNELKERINAYINSLGKVVDILINNSGGPHGGPLIEADEDEFRIAFDRLLICNQVMVKAVFPGMRRRVQVE